MKKSIITEIFLGQTGTIDTIKIPNEIHKSTHLLMEINNTLKQHLSPELFELFEKYSETLSTDCCKEVNFYFTEGFKLGLHIAVESIIG